ncbi:MAG TPA: V-type ATP synthase subunit E [Synergistales bacterium]|nr:V-type ATP synthase subunit E [Synergistales bacterium]
MSLEDIKARIEADAKAEAEGITGKFRDQADEVMKVAKAEVDKLEKATQSKIKTEETEILRRRKIVAELDVRKIQLGTKRDLIDKAFQKALSILSKMPGEKYVPFMTGLLDRSVSSGDETVYVGKEEKILDEKWISDFNSRKKTKLTLSSERVPASGGFVARRGDIYVNCTWDVLLRRIREDLETEVVNRLFPN